MPWCRGSRGREEGGGKGRGNTARVFENETYARGLGELVFAGRRNPDRGNEIFYARPLPLSSTLARVTPLSVRATGYKLHSRSRHSDLSPRSVVDFLPSLIRKPKIDAFPPSQSLISLFLSKSSVHRNSGLLELSLERAVSQTQRKIDAFPPRSLISLSLSLPVEVIHLSRAISEATKDRYLSLPLSFCRIYLTWDYSISLLLSRSNERSMPFLLRHIVCRNSGFRVSNQFRSEPGTENYPILSEYSLCTFSMDLVSYVNCGIFACTIFLFLLQTS